VTSVVQRYIQVETSLARSRLIDRLCESCGIDTIAAIGHMTVFWSAVLEARVGGKVGDRSDRWIEEAAGWRGARGCFAAFVRAHHLDGAGVVRDWMTKYAAIDVRRSKETIRKRNYRQGLTDEGTGAVPGTLTGTVPGTEAGQSLGFSLSSPSSVSSLSSEETTNYLEPSNGKETHEPELRIADQVEAFLAEFEFGMFAPDVEGLLRAARRPWSIIGVLRRHLQGMNVPVRTAAEVGRAVQEYSADNHPSFKSLLFDGYLRGVDRANEKLRSHERGKQEVRSIDSAKAEEKKVQLEEQRIIAMAEQMQSLDPTRYRALEEEARAAVAAEGVTPDNIGYGVLVTGKLRQLVREEMDHVRAH
jgi:hypothetical protein